VHLRDLAELQKRNHDCANQETSTCQPSPSPRFPQIKVRAVPRLLPTNAYTPAAARSKGSPTTQCKPEESVDNSQNFPCFFSASTLRLHLCQLITTKLQTHSTLVTALFSSLLSNSNPRKTSYAPDPVPKTQVQHAFQIPPPEWRRRPAWRTKVERFRAKD